MATIKKLPTIPADADDVLVAAEIRSSFRDRQTGGLAQLMSDRQDLRGVYGLADLVTDGIRWSA